MLHSLKFILLIRKIASFISCSPHFLFSVFPLFSFFQVMILDHDKANGRVALSTKTLEPTPGKTTDLS